MKEEWKKEFDREFEEDLQSIGSSCVNYDGDEIGDVIKQFITDLLNQQRKEILDEIENANTITFAGKKSPISGLVRDKIKELRNKEV